MASESSEPTALSEDEDKAQSTLGKQSALVSVLNMGIYPLNILNMRETDFGLASNYGLDLPDIEDHGYSEEEEEDLRSSRGIYTTDQHFLTH